MAALLNRGWRLIGTALGFTLFGVGGLLLSLFWFPLLALCLRGERRRTLAQLTIRHSFRLFLGVLRGWGVLDYSVSGMPAHLRGALVVANTPEEQREKVLKALLIYSAIIAVVGPVVAWLALIVPGLI